MSEVRALIEKLARLGLSPADAESMVHGRADSLEAAPTLSLVAFDADAIQDQIFASPRPVTIEGASTKLREWDGRLRRGEGLGTSAVALFAGGGNAILLARRDDGGGAPRLREQLEAAFERCTGGSPCTTAAIDLSPRELAAGPLSAGPEGVIVPPQLFARLAWQPAGGGGFGACLARLGSALRREKLKAHPHPLLDGASRAARCAECAERPREGTDARGELCTRCKANCAHGRQTKSDPRWTQAKSFDDVLGKEGERARYAAYIRIDGRGIGAVLESLRTMAQYHVVSSALCRAFELGRDEAELPRERFQVPIAGGDDLLLVVPGQWRNAAGKRRDALTLVAELVERIEQTFDATKLDAAFAGHPELASRVGAIGVGAGVVVTSGLPASFCFDYAGHLVRSAKDALEPPEKARSAIDFVFVLGGSALSSSVTALRDRETAHLDLDSTLQGPLRLTCRPYTLARYRELLERAAVLDDVPRSALHGLETAMVTPNAGLIEVRYQLARQPALRRALAGGDLADLPPTVGPWVLDRVAGSKPTAWKTAIGDLLDALRLVRRDEPGEVAS